MTCLDESVFTGERVGTSPPSSSPPKGGRWGRPAMMAAAEEWTRQQGCTLMTLEVLGTTTLPRPFTRDLGTRSKPSSLPSGAMSRESADDKPPTTAARRYNLEVGQPSRRDAGRADRSLMSALN